MLLLQGSVGAVLLTLMTLAASHKHSPASQMTIRVVAILIEIALENSGQTSCLNWVRNAL